MDDFFPEGFEKWPQSVRTRWVEEYHGLYYPQLDRMPPDLIARVGVKSARMGVDVSDGVVLALEEWAREY